MKKDKSMGSLVEMNQNQLYPRMAKPEDFYKAPPAPMPSTGDALYKMPEAQEMPRCTQDGGMGASGAGTPSVWGEVKGLSSMQNHGEEGTSVSASTGVDFKTGMHSMAGSDPLPK
jgi:hypothetical protein